MRPRAIFGPLLLPAFVFAADSSELRWVEGPAMGFARSAHAVACTGRVAYVVGGTGGEPARAVHEVERFDGRTWSVVTDLPGPGLNAPACVVLDGRLYVIGGFSETTNRPVDTVRVFDPDAGVWSLASPLPGARGGHAAVVLGGKIHVFGGGNDRSTIATHSVYDPATDAWSEAAPLPRAEGSPGGVVHDGRIWAIGGRSGFSDFGDVYVFDPATGVWTSGPSLSPRGTHGAVEFEGTLWVFGGESQEDGRVLGDVLSLEGSEWKPRRSLATPRSYARAVVLDGGVFVIGGSPAFGNSHGSEGSAVVERLGR